MVIDCDSILSRVPPPGAVPVSLAEAAQIWNANGMHGTLRELSIVGMVVKIQAPRPVKGELKVSNLVRALLKVNLGEMEHDAVDSRSYHFFGAGRRRLSPLGL